MHCCSKSHVDNGNNVTGAETAKLSISFAQSTMATAHASLVAQLLDLDGIIKQHATSTGTIIIIPVTAMLSGAIMLLKDRVLNGQVLPRDFAVAQGAGKVDAKHLIILRRVHAGMGGILDAGLIGHGRSKLVRLGAEDNIDTVAVLDTAPQVRGALKIYPPGAKEQGGSKGE
jgi:hypothetical protein